MFRYLPIAALIGGVGRRVPARKAAWPLPARAGSAAPLFASLLSGALLAAPLRAEPEAPPPGFKVAFLGDQGLGGGAQAVLDLVKREGADLLVHLGDFDYTENPAAWEDQYDRILGKDFPIISVVGNHDLLSWLGTGGYAARIAERFRRMGLEVSGDPGARCSFRYRGLFFVLTAPGLIGNGHGEFIRRELEKDSSLWRISAWHVNQRFMQVGSKGDEAGWEVYEESRKGGAIIATAHEHSYSRTHLLSSMSGQIVAERGDTLRLRKGYSFAFVSGLGGDEVRPQLLYGNWWARVYTSTQGAVPGALFATFHADGNPRKAVFAFKAIDGTVPDRFTVYRADDSLPHPEPPPVLPPPAPGPGPRQEKRLEIDPAKLGLGRGGTLIMMDPHGRLLARVENVDGPVSLPMPRSGIVILRLEGADDRSGAQRKFVVLP